MRKKKHPEHENHERWLVSYADFITLLFAFFVVMFAVSQVDSQKMGRFVESVQTAFEYRGVFGHSSANPIQGGSAGVSSDGRPAVVPSKTSLAPATSLSRRGADLKRAIEGTIERSALAGKVRLREDHRGVTVSLSEAYFFAPGSAEVRSDSVETLRTIGEILKGSDCPIVVEGHTDSVPIRNAHYPSNWELSTARATSILSYLITRLEYRPERLAAAGYAEYRPVADNRTAEGRAQNRRVDLVVLTEGSAGPLPR